MAAIDRKNSSADEFMKIHTAYSTFSDPDKRANYDQNLFWQQRTVNSIHNFDDEEHYDSATSLGNDDDEHYDSATSLGNILSQKTSTVNANQTS
ncbi:hypothetical protein JHK87_019197 [Glycine soja]|nr:hypothetical protein JHK87_019197 [Glycine soja]